MEEMNIDFSCPPNEFVASIDVHTLLPQQEPFVMIGSLVHFDMTVTISETKVDANNIFVENSKFSATGLLENIAQSCAARIGYINKYINKKGIQIGLIGAVRNYEVAELPKVGELIRTIITVKEEVFGMILAEAVVEHEGVQIAKTEMKIAVTEEEIG